MERDLTSDGFGYWLAGLIDGEGSFTITPNRPGYLCRMTLSLRDDDSAVLSLISERTGIGKVTMKKVQAAGNRRAQAQWRVQTKGDCQELVAILDRFPLRAKKARDFELWREAVLAMASMPPQVYLGRRGAARQDWTRVAEIKAEMQLARSYREPGVLHVGGMAGGASARSRS